MKNSTKVVNVQGTKTAPKQAGKKVTPKKSDAVTNKVKADNKKIGSYQTNVLEANRELKTAVRSTNQGLKILRLVLGGNPKFKAVVSVINQALKNDKIYKFIDANTRKTAKGTTPFYLLQLIERINAKKVTIQ